jgi:hypothetical protein
MLTDAGCEVARRQAVEPLPVASFCREHSFLRGNALIVEQYRRYPHYAMRSEIIDKLRLATEVLARMEAAKPERHPAGVVTIGYEGRSLESYLNELLRDGVRRDRLHGWCAGGWVVGSDLSRTFPQARSDGAVSKV